MRWQAGKRCRFIATPFRSTLISSYLFFTQHSFSRVFRAFHPKHHRADSENFLGSSSLRSVQTLPFAKVQRVKKDHLCGSLRNMRPIFCGNLDYDARQSDVERLFRRYGKVDRVDMKSGFAFVYMDDERDAEDAIRRIDRIEFGRKGRRLRVEWTKQERGIRRPGDSRRSSANTRPSKTLFVINFDPIHTRTRDLERHFDQYGKILNIRIRRNFAFIQYELQEDATRALDATNMSKFMDRVITVEYAIRDDDDRRNGYSPDRRGRDMSPDRSYDRGRSPSPYRRDRASPDYGHGSNPGSRPEPRGSPKYDRDESPVNERYHSRSPPPRERSRS